MRKIGLISLALAAAMLPSTMFAGRINGFFPLQQQDQAIDTNDSCVEVFFDEFRVDGVVTSVNTANGCTTQIFYDTPQPHKASSSALQGSKTKSSSKISQSIYSEVRVLIFDTTLGDLLVCPTPYNGSVQENVEKCKVDGSLKVTDGTANSQSGSVSASCELGEAGVNLVPAPSQATIDTVVAGFADRKDVKIANDGKLSIKQKGVPDAGGSSPCD